MSTFKMPANPVEAYQRGILANAQADREGVERDDDLQDEMALMWHGSSERGRENMQLSGSILNESFADPLSYLTPENYMEHLSIRQDELRLQRERKQLDERYRRAGLYPRMQRLLTLEQTRLAEDKRAESEKARADADNAYRNAIGLNVSEFVTLQVADKQIEACKAAKECVILPPGTGTVVSR